MKLGYIYAAILIGIAVVVGMLLCEFNIHSLSQIQFTWAFFSGIVGAAILVTLQNLMMATRFKLLAGAPLTLRNGLRVDLMCEFTSAVTPSSVGGSGFTFLYLNREGISMGHSTFAMLAALLADEAFLSVSSLLLFLFVPIPNLQGPEWLHYGMKWLFGVSSVIVLCWSALLLILIFYRPEWIAGIVAFVCKLPWLRRFHSKILRFSADLRVASMQARQKSLGFWMKIAAVTAVAWMSRFGVAVAVLSAFAPQGSLFQAWMMQWVLWMVSMISPTPGGSGLAELMFGWYYRDYFADASMVVIAVMIWRLLSYYSYLIIGTILLPGVFRKNRKATDK